MNAPIRMDTTQLAMEAAVTIAEAPFVELEHVSRELAAMAACGFLSKQDAVDVAHWAACKAIGYGTWYRHDPDEIQKIIATGFELVTSKPPLAKPLTYETPEATVHAFWYVVSLKDEDYLTGWLADHPMDAPYLQKLLEDRCTKSS